MVKKKLSLKQKRKIPFYTILCAGLLFLLGWIYGNRGDWFRFACSLTGVLMIIIMTAGFLVCLKLDEMSERLEQLLDKKSLSKSERANSEAKEDISAEDTKTTSNPNSE